MPLDDRPYYRDPGYSTNRFAAIFSGSLPLYTAFGIRVRAHAALILFVICEVLLNWQTGYDLPSKLASMGLLFGIVLLHEYGHCLAARRVGGSASEILLTPFGGLAFPDVPDHPSPRFWTSAAGPLVNVLICLVTGVAVYLLTGSRITLNPFQSYVVPAGITWHSAAFYLWWTFRISYVLLLFNILPIYPLDGGQMFHHILWNFIGYRRSLNIACIVGMAGAMILGIVGLVDHFNFLLVCLAAFIFQSCVQRRMILRESGPIEPWQTDEMDYSASLRAETSSRERKTSIKTRNTARKRARQAVMERRHIDMILAKVSAKGMNSLTWRERRALRKATEKLRQSEQEMKQILGD
jgi:Zn-dependent protease